jgi:hypothetical protein
MKRPFWAAVMVAATLVGSAGPAAATGVAAPASSAELPPGDISTIAGGLGWPGPATAVSLAQNGGCYGMQVAGGQLYVNGAGAERAINVRTGVLRTVATQLLPVFFSGGTRVPANAQRLLRRHTVRTGLRYRFGGTCYAIHSADIAVVITTSGFTRQAREYAARMKIWLFDQQALAAWLSRTGTPPWPVP